MTEPHRYHIESLLNRGLQPFDDLSEDALDALGKAIVSTKGVTRNGGGRAGLTVPVIISSDGLLLDGHQRLKAMRREGRKFISAEDVRIEPRANSANALEWAIRFNVQRRHLSVEQKADIARRLQRERLWSQAKIAEVFGVSRPAVSQWLEKYPGSDDEAEAPDVVEGLDGRVRATPPKPKSKPPKHDLAPGGKVYTKITAARRSLQREMTVEGLTVLQKVKVEAELTDLIEASESLLNSLSE